MDYKVREVGEKFTANGVELIVTHDYGGRAICDECYYCGEDGCSQPPEEHKTNACFNLGRSVTFKRAKANSEVKL